MSDKIAYTKVSDTFINSYLTADGNDGPLLDDEGNVIYMDILQYNLGIILSTDDLPILDDDGNEIF